MASKIRLTKGNEFAELEKHLNDLYDKLLSPQSVEGATKSYQDIAVVKKDDGTHVIQFRTKEGVIESAPSTFKRL
jgi:hypothetical protein